jgi:ABC-type multidrug transport system ATPase subunit
MQISLQQIGKKYNQDWIFRNIDYDFHSGESYAILGSNGSGKSTLLQIIAGKIVPTTGTITYGLRGHAIAVEDIFRYLGLSTPYQELIEEYTLAEMLKFHHRLKPLYQGIGELEFLDILAFPGIKNKQIRYFSSGMKQRLKLALAILSDVRLLLLDEPCANLDKQGIRWYNELIAGYGKERLILVCSNHQEEETGFCTKHLRIDDFR